MFLGEVKCSEVAQLCPTLCDPMDCSLQGSSNHGIFQVRVLEWIVISFSSGYSWPRDQTRVSRIVGRHFTVWTTYFENDFTTKCNLQIQCDPYQIINGIFHRTRRKKFHNSYGNTKTLSSQSSQKEEWSWGNQPSWLQIILQSYGHQDSMILAQKEKYRPME